MKRFAYLGILSCLAASGTAWAADAAPLTPETVQLNLNFVWTLIAAFLVFFMQAGFALVEAGFTRAKNCCNILMKNFLDFGMGSIFFFIIGFGLMFGASDTGFFGWGSFMLSDFEVSSDPWVYAFFMFQLVFAATSATIVSGALAERTKFSAYLIFSALMTALIYPVFGSWAWGGLYKGGGWLESLGFIDFAGSTVVHSIGGWAALAGAIAVGPRIGKFGSDGKPRAILGHSIPLAATGVFILFFGWFGFNPGSTTVGDTSIALISVTTALAGAAGMVATTIYTWVRYGKPDIGMTLNGILGGLVGITAGCANVSPVSSIIIGAFAGVLVTESVIFFDRIKVDDPVGAISVHGVCGAWGTLAAAIFDAKGFSLAAVGVQAVGVLAAFAWSFGTSMAVFTLLKATIGLRVSAEEEINGLDIYEHGIPAYSDLGYRESSSGHASEGTGGYAGTMAAGKAAGA